jgi:hypothetical protein
MPLVPRRLGRAVGGTKGKLTLKPALELYSRDVIVEGSVVVFMVSPVFLDGIGRWECTERQAPWPFGVMGQGAYPGGDLRLYARGSFMRLA